MTQADRVHSTPPTNSSAIDATRSPGKPRSRRSVLGAIAAATAAVTVAAARPAGAASAVDPIYAAIERHKAACVPWDAAIDTRAEFPESADPMTDEQWEQRNALDDAVDEARVILEQGGLDLVNTAPTTATGITTAIRYMQRQMRTDGTYMPYEIEFEFDEGYTGDGGQVLGWIDVWLDTIAGAVAALDMAVQS
jgi:hypothetical protein